MNPLLHPAHPARSAIAAGLAIALTGLATFASVATARPAATLPVTSCADDGSAGTLRSVIAAAANGDTVDLGGLSCSTISLSQGQIAIPVEINELTVHGPATPLTIDAGTSSGILAHYGTGTLFIEQLTLANGSYPGGGACVFSQGSVVLDRVTVSNCASAEAAGGGVLALGNLTLESSTLAGNSALVGGGAAANGAILIRNSTISGNSASAIGGGLYAGGQAAQGDSVTIQNSTFSANQTTNGGGGLYLAYDAALTITSSIFAGNTGAAGYGVDIGAAVPITIAGNHNLIVNTTLAVPADTLTVDPQLLPLADNGGPTRTHALAMGSPALDAGSNNAALEFDQRGSGYARSVGTATDIGAFERQELPPDDLIFANGFDGADP